MLGITSERFPRGGALLLAIIGATGSFSTAIAGPVMGSINDRYGRHIGDEVLRHVSRTVRSTLRVADFLFRYNGDEFIAFLSGAEIETANGVSQRVTERLDSSPVPLAGGETLAVAVTVCVALSDRDGRSLADLIAAARNMSSNPQPAASRVH